MDRGILQGDIEKLASASVTQLTRRFKEYTGIDAPRDMFNQGAFGSYLRYLVVEGSEVTRAIIKPSHFLGRVPAEERNFFKDIADRTEASYRQLLTEGTGSFERLFAFYPRAAVLTEPIPEDVIEGSPFRKKIKAELFRLNRRIRSKV